MASSFFKSVMLSLALVPASVFAFARTNAAACVELSVPAAIAPAWRDFEARCIAGKASRGDLIAFKRFIAVSDVSADLKVTLTKRARNLYQESIRKKSAKGTK